MDICRPGRINTGIVVNYVFLQGTKTKEEKRPVFQKNRLQIVKIFVQNVTDDVQ
jgi:hypothetical protein